MTTTEIASPDLQARVLDALTQCTDARQAQFASHLDAARAGTLSRAYALGVLRQVRGFVAPAEGEDQIKMPRGNGETRTSTRSNLASEAQARFAVDLLRTRVQPDERVAGTVKTAAEMLALFEACGQMARDIARNVIDAYKDRPRIVQVVEAAPVEPKAAAAPRAAKAAPVELAAGMYRVADVVYKVQKSRQSGRMYAKRLVVHSAGDASFEYDSGAVRKITPEDMMSLEDAKEFGHVYGVCCNCGATLTDEVSISEGIGPVCKRKF